MALISSDQREHLKLLREHPEGIKHGFNKDFQRFRDFYFYLFVFLVSIDICKLALEYLSNGLNAKKCQIAASKFH